MDRASRPAPPYNGGNSVNPSPPFAAAPTSLQSLLPPRHGRHHPNPNPNPPLSGFDRALEAAFSGLRVSPSDPLPPYAGIDSGFGGYGVFSGESKRSSNIELLMRLRFLENEYAAAVATATAYRGSPGSFLLPAESFVQSPGFFPPAARALSDLRRQRLGGLSGKLPGGQPRLNRNGFPDRVVDSEMVVDGSNSFKSGLFNMQRDLLQNQKPQGELGVKDLRGMIVSLSKDQNGCRVLQKMIEALRKEEDIEMIFSEVMEHVGELMIDPFGNYVVQKLVEVGREEQRNQILLMVTQSDVLFASICLNAHGTRAVQKLLEHLTTQEQITLVMAALSPCVVALAKDMNGQHVILYCLKNFSHHDNKYLLNEVADNCIGLAMDKCGCCVLQQCVEYSRGKLRERLVAQLTASALLLAEDRFGNYVVQHLLGLREHQITVNLLKKFERRYVSLSRNKFGSNVVEKCLTEVAEDQSTYIILELLEHQNVAMLLLDPYGNFVIQSALKVSKRFVHNRVIHKALLDLVRTNYKVMCSNQYGKKILTWFDGKKKQQHT